jgi:hypothetical protein
MAFSQKQKFTLHFAFYSPKIGALKSARLISLREANHDYRPIDAR